MKFANNLVRVLDQKNITQKELAKAVGVSEPFITYVIKGYKLPSLPVLARIVEYLDVPYDEILR